MGGITEIATSAPGYNSIRPNTAAPLAETLKLNGYSTAQFGKCHEVPVWETSPMGPFDAWPSGGGGFEHFYGFIGGETNQYAPAIYDGTVPVEPDRTPGGGLPLHRGHDGPGDRLDPPAEGADAGQAVLRLLRARRHARPAPRADRVVGQVQGQVRPGLGRAPRGDLRPPEGARRDPARRRADGAPRGDPGLGRHAGRPEAGAGPPDGGLCRLPRAHRPPRRPADRRASRTSRSSTTRSSTTSSATTGPPPRARRRAASTRSIVLNGAGGLETTEFMASRIDQFGTPEAYNHYAVGWAHAMDTPYQWTKQVASHWGGTRNGTIVHWPNGFRARGEIRSQFSHVIDIAATVLDAAGLPEPVSVHGVQQMPLHGKSMVPTLRRRRRARAPRDPVLRDVREPRHLPQGLDRRHPPQHPLGDGGDPADRRRRVGAVRARRLDAGARRRQGARPRSCTSCSACS